MLVESVCNGAGERLALIIRSSYHADGVVFFTEPELSQQLAFISHPEGKEIAAHVHNYVPRSFSVTQEVLFIRQGKLRVDFYNDQRGYLESRELSAGDCILLIKGGHGFKVLEDVEMIEVKQGPYLGETDKSRFEKQHEYDPH